MITPVTAVTVSLTLNKVMEVNVSLTVNKVIETGLYPT